jgi:hypothetical protein
MSKSMKKKIKNNILFYFNKDFTLQFFFIEDSTTKLIVWFSTLEEKESILSG